MPTWQGYSDSVLVAVGDRVLDTAPTYYTPPICMDYIDALANLREPLESDMALEAGQGAAAAAAAASRELWDFSFLVDEDPSAAVAGTYAHLCDPETTDIAERDGAVLEAFDEVFA